VRRLFVCNTAAERQTLTARFEPVAQPDEGAVQSDLDCVRPQAENLRDPARAEVGAVAQGDQLLLALVEARDRGRERETPDRALLEIAAVCRLRELQRQQRPGRHRLGKTAPGNADQPRERRSSRGVVGFART
jgi:hypothetical protein